MYYSQHSAVSTRAPRFYASPWPRRFAHDMSCKCMFAPWVEPWDVGALAPLTHRRGISGRVEEATLSRATVLCTALPLRLGWTVAQPAFNCLRTQEYNPPLRSHHRCCGLTSCAPCKAARPSWASHTTTRRTQATTTRRSLKGLLFVVQFIVQPCARARRDSMRRSPRSETRV